jgi:hypothetical protein
MRPVQVVPCEKAGNRGFLFFSDWSLNHANQEPCPQVAAAGRVRGGREGLQSRLHMGHWLVLSADVKSNRQV